MIKPAKATLELAIRSEEYGERIRTGRILTPAEVERVEVLKRVRSLIEKIGPLDKEMAGKLEAAIDDQIHFQDLAKAWLPEEEYLRMGWWESEGPAFRVIDEAVALMEFVVDTYRNDLRGYRIACVFQQKINPVARRTRIGSATKLPGKMHYLSEWHAVITLAFEEWRSLADADRQRLMHHELEHLQVEDGRLVLMGHDFEDFGSIVSLYGLRSVSGRMAMDGRVGDAIERAVNGQMELGEEEEWDLGPAAFRRAPMEVTGPGAEGGNHA